MAYLDVADITEIARGVISQQTLPLTVVGTVVTGSGSHYVELLVTINGCAASPCRFSVGLLRNASEADVARAIAIGLHEHLEAHRSPV